MRMGRIKRGFGAVSQCGGIGRRGLDAAGAHQRTRVQSDVECAHQRGAGGTGGRRRSERDDLPDVPSRTHRGEGVFDVVESDAAVDQAIDRADPRPPTRHKAENRPRVRRSRSSSQGSGANRRRMDRPRTTRARRSGSCRQGLRCRRPAAEMASSAVDDRPIASKTKSGPPSVRSPERLDRGGGIVICEQPVRGPDRSRDVQL